MEQMIYPLLLFSLVGRIQEMEQMIYPLHLSSRQDLGDGVDDLSSPSLLSSRWNLGDGLFYILVIGGVCSIFLLQEEYVLYSCYRRSMDDDEDRIPEELFMKYTQDSRCSLIKKILIENKLFSIFVFQTIISYSWSSPRGK